MLTYFAGYLIAAQVGGRIFDARGAKPTILLGCLVSAGGLLWWASQVTALDDTWISRLPIAVAGAGIGLMLGPASADAVSRATHSWGRRCTSTTAARSLWSPRRRMRGRRSPATGSRSAAPRRRSV